MPVTAAGIPYPTTQDPLAETPRFIRELDAAAQAKLSNPPVIARAVVFATDGNGDYVVTIPEFITLAGIIAQLRHPLDYPVTAVCMALAGNTARVQLTRVWRTNGNSNGQANTTAPFTNATIWMNILAWGVPA